MIFEDSSARALKDYLSRELEPICDCDPAVLADYVIALLKHDKSTKDLKQLCMGQLQDFLREETEPFTIRLFDVLQSKSYAASTTSGDRSRRSQHSAQDDEPDAAPSESELYRQPERPPETNEISPLKTGVRKRADSDASEDDGDRNYKHRDRISGDSRDENRRDGERLSGRDERESKSKRFRSENIGTGSATGIQHSSVPDDRSSKRRRDESEDESRSTKMPRNTAAGSGQSGGSGNGHVSGNGVTPGGGRRGDFDRDNRVNNRSYGAGAGNTQGPGVGSGRWGNEWSTNGIGAPMGERYDDRRMRSGRIADRIGTRPPNALGMNRNNFSDNRSGRRQRCRDYDEKGYCMRGDLCPFDHGVDRIVVDDVPMNRSPFDLMPPMGGGPMSGPVGMMGPGVPGRPPFYMGPSNNRNQYEIDTSYPDAYDPERATLSRPDELISPVSESKEEVPQITESSQSESTISLTPTPPTSHFMDKTQSGRGSAFRGRGRGRGGRGGFTRANAAHQKNTTLVVENIPQEFCAIDKVNEFFKKFGTIVNIQVDFAYSKALVQFSSHAEASKAYNSPEPIFDNRFVKVYWQKADKEDQLQEKQKHEQHSQKQHGTDVTAQKPGLHTVNPSTAKSEAAQARASDPQAQAQAEKKKESLKAVLELHKQKQQLIQRQIEEQKKLMELAKSKNFDEKTREEVSKRLQKVSEEIKQDKSPVLMKPFLTGGHGISTKALMEQKERERLDRELDMLNRLNVNDAQLEEAVIKDTEVTETTPDASKPETASVSSAALVGGPFGYQSRGRGFFYRGRARASWPRARGAAIINRYKLDNRTTKLLLKQVPPGSQDSLRTYFEQFGELETVNMDDETRTAIVHFKNRKEAEQALIKGSVLPDVGPVKMTWYTDHVGAAPIAETIPATASVNLDLSIVNAPKTTDEVDNGGRDVVSNDDAVADYYDEDEDDSREKSWKR